MTTDYLRGCVKQIPFQPFSLHLNDGRSIPVPHPDYLMVPPEGHLSTTVIAWEDSEKFQFVSVRNIASVSSSGKPPAMPKRKRGGGRGDGEDWKGGRDDE